MAYQFTQKTGPRKGQKFNVKQGASGKSERVYASGDTANVSHPYYMDRLRKKRMTTDSAVSQVTPRKGAIKDQIARVRDPAPFKGKQSPPADLTKARETLLRQRVQEFAAKKRKVPRRTGPAKY